MEGNSGARRETVLAANPLWGPSATATKTTVGLSEPKNDLSASKWATTTKIYKKITPPPGIPKENAAHIQNSTFWFNHEATSHLWDPPEPTIHNNSPAIYHSDTALDDDGDVVMMDLHDPYIIQKVTEFTRNQRQAEKMSEYADLKPGLRPAISKSRIAQPSCLLVIDTNFILTHLQLIGNLVNSHPHRKNIVVVPWAAIQELDGLKKSRHRLGGFDVSRLARYGINWAFNVFSRLEPGVWGQSKEECEDPNDRGDSAILDCCRYFGASHETVLLSDDRNLCVQAMIHNIKTVTIINKPHTAETILTRILGDATHPTVSRKPAPHSPCPLSVDHAGLTYNQPSSYTPPKLPANLQAPSAAPPTTHNPVSVYMQPTYRAADVNQQMIQPAFYSSIAQHETNHFLYGTSDKGKPISPGITRNGLEASIHACRNVVPRDQHRTQAIKTARPPLRMTKSFFERKTTAQYDKSDAETKNNLNYFLQRIATELVTNLVPLLRQCARDKLVGATEHTLEALDYFPEKQIRSIIDLEKFFHDYWVPVFCEYLPEKCGHVFKSGGLNRRWSEWIHWTEFSEPGYIAPKIGDVKKWIEEWDFIWKRILPTEASERQVDANMNAVDWWRSALPGIGLAAE